MHVWLCGDVGVWGWVSGWVHPGVCELGHTHTHTHTHTLPVFFQSGCLPRTLESFEKAGNWQMTFALSARLGYSVTERMQLARRVAGKVVYRIAGIFGGGLYLAN